MERGKIHFIVFLLTIFGLFGSLAGVLSIEERKRLERAQADRQAFLAEQQSLDQIRKQYFDEVEAKRAASRAGMTASQEQYDQALQDQPAALVKNQTTTTETVTVPVRKIVNTPVAKPKTSRSTKSS